MIISKINKRTKTISVLILTIIAFVFLHSELGLFNFDEDRHEAHDYCEIVKSVTVKITNNVSKDIFKLKIEKAPSFNQKDETQVYAKDFAIFNFEHFYKPKKTTKVYLLNRAFLI